MEFSTIINWASPFFSSYSNFTRTFCKQTVETLIRRHILRHLIWFCPVCLCPSKRRLDLYELILCMLYKYCMLFCSLQIFLIHIFFKKVIQEYYHQCQIVCIQITLNVGGREKRGQARQKKWRKTLLQFLFFWHNQVENLLWCSGGVKMLCNFQRWSVLHGFR